MTEVSHPPPTARLQNAESGNPSFICPKIHV